MYRLKIVAAYLLVLFFVQQGFGQRAASSANTGDYFPKESVWFNTTHAISMNMLKNKFTIVLVSDVNCLECGYYAKTLETMIDYSLPVQLIQVLLPNAQAPYSRSSILNFIQQNAYNHPIAVVPDLSGFASEIKSVPYFLVYDKSDVPSISAQGDNGFRRVLEKIEDLKKDKELLKSYVNYPIIPEIPTANWANPVIETPTYLATEEYASGFYVNDVAHHRIVGLNRNGEFQNVAGTSILSGFDNGQEGNIRFQNAHGITAYNGKLYVADTYNNRVRVVDHERILATTVIGDGTFDSLALPTDVEVWKKKLYAADGFYNQIRVIDIENKSSVVFANLPSKYVGMMRTYPINLAAGKKGLYVVMSDGEIFFFDKKGKVKTIANKDGIRFSAVAEWKGGLMACAPDSNAVYFKKKDQWNILTTGTDSISVNAGVLPLNHPFDIALVASEVYITDRDNHQIRVIHSEKESTPQPFSLVLSDMLISDEAAHTFGQLVEMDTIFVAKDVVAAKVKIDLQGYKILEGGQNLLIMHNTPIAGDLLSENITSDEFAFTVNPIKEEDALYIECYLTLEHPSRPKVPVIKRAYLVFHLEPVIKASTKQEFTYRPDLLPH